VPAVSSNCEQVCSAACGQARQRDLLANRGRMMQSCIVNHRTTEQAYPSKAGRLWW